MPASRSKYVLVADRLSRRIRSGDYHVHGLPAERALADQVGVSYMTVRKAVQLLLDRGLLARLPNGRLTVPGSGEEGTTKKQIALLAPAWQSNEVALWDIGLAQLRSRFDFGSRIVHYVHWDDPTIASTIRQFDATFFLPPDFPSPEFASELTKLGRPFVVLNRDWSGLGVRSVRLLPPRMIRKLLDHLASLGHRRIDCFNVQPCGQVIREWIGHWQTWRAARAIEGELVNEPVVPFTETLVAAYDVAARRIRDGQFNSTAMLCLTETAAIGVTRAMLDHGLRPGHDVALCTTGSTRCEYLSPSLTTLEQPDPKPYLAVCFDAMFGEQSRDVAGPLLIEPKDLDVAVRESTVPDVSRSRVPARLRHAVAGGTAGATASAEATPSEGEPAAALAAGPGGGPAGRSAGGAGAGR